MLLALLKSVLRRLPSGKRPATQLPLAPSDPAIEPAPAITSPPAIEAPTPIAALKPSIEDPALALTPKPPEAKPEPPPDPGPVLLMPPPSLPEFEPKSEPLSIVVSGDRSAYFARVRRQAASAHRVIAPDLAARVPHAGTAPKVHLPAEPEPTAIDVTAASAEPLSIFATGYGNPSSSPGVVRSIDPGLFTSLIANREGCPHVPPHAVQEYLTDPALLKHALELRSRVLNRQFAGEPPLSKPEFYQLSYSIAEHSSTALLLCHNVAKAFARGGQHIRWQIVNRARGEFTDGQRVYFGRNFFFALFSAAPDSGDWYRFFAHAALASFTARGETRFPGPLAQPEAAELARRHEKLAEQFQDISDSPQAKAALWSNTFSFWEAGCFARNLQRCTELVRLSRAACRFAFEVNGITADPQHPWRVPQPGALWQQWDLGKATASRLTADG